MGMQNAALVRPFSVCHLFIPGCINTAKIGSAKPEARAYTRALLCSAKHENRETIDFETAQEFESHRFFQQSSTPNSVAFVEPEEYLIASNKLSFRRGHLYSDAGSNSTKGVTDFPIQLLSKFVSSV